MLLPPKKKIAPNQNSWPKTAVAMNVHVMSKQKTHTDPYAGGEHSGKKAKTDEHKVHTPTAMVELPVPVPVPPIDTSLPVTKELSNTCLLHTSTYTSIYVPTIPLQSINTVHYFIESY